LAHEGHERGHGVGEAGPMLGSRGGLASCIEALQGAVGAVVRPVGVVVSQNVTGHVGRTAVGGCPRGLPIRWQFLEESS